MQMPNHMKKIPIIGFVAKSGTGKTTLICKLLKMFDDDNINVAVIKGSHHNFDIDIPGKDSYKLRSCGASCVLLSSPYKWVMMANRKKEHIPNLQDELNRLNQDNLDLIIVEGFKNEDYLKIEINRKELKNELLYRIDKKIIAVASDYKINLPNSLTLLDINNIKQIYSFLKQILFTTS
ncbi:MAG: molybdopterin-guanine dinucleotide biosynthesis protein B [Gammaproteobacteria bacterium]|nr:MAG: molybdopterin-guanine dinucleotide biosynthesis protein B [Gammaproteobacteria bacterium]